VVPVAQGARERVSCSSPLDPSRPAKATWCDGLQGKRQA
jgi:hypothetical protein